VYGSLQPGQLAHHQIAALVEQGDPATAHGFGIWIRDGLPYIHSADGAEVHGVLLWPRVDVAEEFYQRAREYETGDLYREESISVRTANGFDIQAQVFAGKLPGRGHPEAMLHGDWSAKTEPLFLWGLETVTTTARELLEAKVPMVAPGESGEFWSAFVPLQGTFLVLCTILERYTTLVYGAGKNPMERLRLLGQDPDAQAAVYLAKAAAAGAVDSRTARSPRTTTDHAPFAAWYQVRSNLTHRGKAAIHDYALVARALVGLHDALRFLLALKLTPGSTEKFAPEEKLLRGLSYSPAAEV
jgi:gamma-glutamylcyclotransferase (GGCT)/AIG2-like uncharacterized protein YtfP